MGRSATTPRQGEFAAVVITVATERPRLAFGNVPKSLFTDSVQRLSCATVTCLVTGAPLSNKYSILTGQSLTLLGFPIVRNSSKPEPTRPSAKYHVLLTGPEGVVGGGEPLVVKA